MVTHTADLSRLPETQTGDEEAPANRPGHSGQRLGGRKILDFSGKQTNPAPHLYHGAHRQSCMSAG